MKPTQTTNLGKWAVFGPLTLAGATVLAPTAQANSTMPTFRGDIGSALPTKHQDQPVKINYRQAHTTHSSPHRGVHSKTRARHFYAHRSSALHRSAVVLQSSNLVEPLSNGLRFTMLLSQVVRRYGQPQKIMADKVRYPHFMIAYDPDTHRMNIVGMEANIKLHCGIGAGSSFSDVARVFGRPNVDGDVIYQQYRICFAFENNRVTDIIVAVAPGNRTFH